ncbi:unnamed protein product [Closterium sp. NIES-54]
MEGTDGTRGEALSSSCITSLSGELHHHPPLPLGAMSASSMEGTDGKKVPIALSCSVSLSGELHHHPPPRPHLCLKSGGQEGRVGAPGPLLRQHVSEACAVLCGEGGGEEVVQQTVWTVVGSAGDEKGAGNGSAR